MSIHNLNIFMQHLGTIVKHAVKSKVKSKIMPKDSNSGCVNVLGIPAMLVSICALSSQLVGLLEY